MLNIIRESCQDKGIKKIDVFVSDNLNDLIILIAERHREPFQQRKNTNHQKWFRKQVANNNLKGILVSDNLFINSEPK